MVVAPVLVWVILPEAAPPADGLYLTYIFVDATVPPEGANDKVDGLDTNPEPLVNEI